MKNIRIAAVISEAKIGQTQQNLGRMAQWICKASQEKAAIVCFPEMSITGYAVRGDIQQTAEAVPGPATDFLAGLARRHEMAVLAGLAEAGPDGQVFATHLVITPDGALGIYRKTHPGPPEKPVFTPGNTIPVFSYKGLKFGIQLCYDAHFPELTTAMALQGADAVFIPHASPRGTPDEKRSSWMRHLPARAYDNALFIIAANLCGENGHGLCFPGVGLALNPAGRVMASCTGSTEQMMVVDLKAADLNAIRTHPMGYFLPHRRPELYGINSSQAKLRPNTLMEPANPKKTPVNEYFR